MCKKKLFDRISDLENRIIKDKDKKLYTISDECIEKIIKRKCEIESKINNDTIYKKKIMEEINPPLFLIPAADQLFRSAA